MFSSDNTPYEKVGKNEPVSIADDVPFDIPDSWKWCRLGTIFYHNTGKALNASNQSGQLLEYITTSNLYWNRFELGTLRKMFFTDSEIEKCTATKGDLLVCEGGDFGRAAIWPFDYDIRIQNHIHRLRAYAPVCTEFYYYIFYLYKHVGWIGGKGIGIQGLSSNALHALLFPLPPVEEQKRIVDIIRKIDPITEKYEIAEAKLNALNTGFPDQLKKSILQMAVQGKLVPQDPNDEPASVLLERIRAEKERLITEGKIKRDKNESVIFRRDNSHYENRDGKERCINDEIPFDIPESWAWVRLSSVADLSLGKMLDKAKNKGALQPYLRNVNVRWGSFDFDDILQMRFTDDEDARYSVQSGDVIMCEGGEPGRCAVWEYTSKFKIQKALHRIRPYSMVSSHYLFLLFSLYAKNGCFSSLFTGTTIKHLPGIKLAQVLVPLPPSNEQVRIIDFANTVMIELEKLTLDLSL